MQNVMKVYLSGGMRTDWQEKVKKACPNLLFADPMLNCGGEFEEYAAWDVHAVRVCDLVFCYMERSNPCGAGLGAEVGHAKGLGKTVILVLEKDNEHQPDRYLLWLSKMADVTYDDFDKGVEHLKSYQGMFK